MKIVNYMWWGLQGRKRWFFFLPHPLCHLTLLSSLHLFFTPSFQSSLPPAPGDYNATTQTLTFTPTQSTHTVTVMIVDDTIPEDDEDFSASLTTSDGDVTLSPDRATALIVNDDGEDTACMHACTCACVCMCICAHVHEALTQIANSVIDAHQSKT